MAVGCRRTLGWGHFAAGRGPMLHSIHPLRGRHGLSRAHGVADRHRHASRRRAETTPTTSLGTRTRAVAVGAGAVVILVRRAIPGVRCCLRTTAVPGHGHMRPLRHVHAGHLVRQIRIVVVAASSRVLWRVRLRAVARESIAGRTSHWSVHGRSPLRSCWKRRTRLAAASTNRTLSCFGLTS